MRRFDPGIPVFILLFAWLLHTGLERNRMNMEGVIWSDVAGYYAYLPAVFIHGDFNHFPVRGMNERKSPDGILVTKFTCGTSAFYVPFFLASHIAAQAYHYDATGYTQPYFIGMIVCGAFWSVVGLWLLRRLLLRYFSHRATWLALLAIMFGTNYYHYATKWVGMSHNYNFVLMTGLLLTADEYYRRPRRSLMLLLAALFGWLVMTRPTNIIAILPLLLLHTASSNDIRNRLQLLLHRWKDIVAGIPFFLLALLPQLLYWHHMHGQWLVYSYEEEGFIYWMFPRIINVLFDTSNGFFLYAPVMLLAIPALISLRKIRSTNTLAVSITFVLATYIFGSWWAWDFGAAFGHRCYIEYLPLFAFPLTAFMQKYITDTPRVALRVTFSILLLGLAYYTFSFSNLMEHEDTNVYAQWDWNKWWGLTRHALVWRR